jgi:co-chaperonin GroES (HSP10)
MKNESGLKPLGRAVLLAPYEPEIKSSVIAIPDTVLDRTRMIDQRAVVVEVGPEAWKEESQPRAVPGDKVMIARYSGILVQGPNDGQSYRVVNCNDIFTAIVTEKENG